jgi:hypothetical protein
MNDDDVEVLMARLPLRMRLIALARMWGAIEKMMQPRKIDEKTRAAWKAAGRKDLDF